MRRRHSSQEAGKHVGAGGDSQGSARAPLGCSGIPASNSAIASTVRSSLRSFEDDRGWIKTLLDEAQNERAHLMTFTHLATPNWFERCLIIAAQGVFFNLYFFTYLFWPRA